MTSKRSIHWFLESSRAWSFFTRAFAKPTKSHASFSCRDVKLSGIVWTATAPDWNRSFIHIEHSAAPGRLAERVWYTKLQSSFLYFRPKRVPVLAPAYSLPLRSQYLFKRHQSVAQNLSDRWRSTIGTASFRYRNRAEITALTVNGSLIWYSLRAGARAI